MPGNHLYFLRRYQPLQPVTIFYRLVANELIFLHSKTKNTMAEKMDVVTKAFSRFLTGFCLSKAMHEDYARVVAKLENVPEQEVIDRVRKRSDEIFEEVKAKQLQETEAAESQ